MKMYVDVTGTQKILRDLKGDAEDPPRSDLSRLGRQGIGGSESGELAASRV